MLFGEILFPGEYLLSWFEPWKSDYTLKGVPVLAHKPVLDDVIRQLYPYKILIGDAIRRLEMPLWNPYNGSGMPLMATMHAGMLNPVNIVFALLNPLHAWNLYMIFQPLFLSVFIMFYLTVVGISFYGSIFASVVFIFSGAVIVRYGYGEYLYVFSCLPLLLGLWEIYQQNNKLIYIYLIAPVITFMVFSGQPQIIFYVLLYFLVYIIGTQKKVFIDYRLLFSVVMMILLGLLMGAVQLLPTLELYLRSGLSVKSSAFIFEKFLMPVWHYVTVFIPNYFGNRATYNYWGGYDYIETSVYLGTIPVFLAFLAVFTKEINFYTRKRLLIHTGIFLFSILLTLSWIGTSLFYKLPLPILSTGVPTRLFLPLSFAVAVLSAYGFDKLFKREDKSNKIIKIISGYAMFLGIILVITFIAYSLKWPCPNEIIYNCRTIALRNTAFEVSGFGVFFLFTILSLIFKKIPFKQYLPLFFILIILVYGAYNANKFLPFTKSGKIYPDQPLAKWLKSNASYNRIIGLGDAVIEPNISSQLRIFDPQYYDPLYSKRYGELVFYVNYGHTDFNLPRSDVTLNTFKTDNKKLKDRLLRFMELTSTKYQIYKAPSVIFENSKLIKVFDHSSVSTITSLPRAYLTYTYVKKTDKKSILAYLFSNQFNAKKEVVLEQDIPHKSLLNNIIGKAEIIKYDPNQVNIKTVTKTQALLTLTDNHYPGWTAYVDGKQVPIYRSNYSFRTIIIPKGEHLVKIIYKPISIIIGIIISIVSTVYLIIKFKFSSKSVIS